MNAKYNCRILSLACILFMISCPSCNNNISEAEKLVTEWQGRRIRLIDSLECRIMGKDTAGTDLLRKKCKIFVNVDSTGCFACKTKLEEWKEFIREISPISDKVSIIFCFHSSDYESIDLLFLQHGVAYPVFIDRKGEINKLNQFPKNNSVNVFLLNANNEVEIIGSPINNHRMWRLYRNQINALTGLKDEDWPETARMGWSQ